jgi:hypothetical protein
VRGHPFTECKNIKCQICYEYGHPVEVCPNRKDIERRLREFEEMAEKENGEKVEEHLSGEKVEEHPSKKVDANPPEPDDSLRPAGSERPSIASSSSLHLSPFHELMDAPVFVPRSDTCSLDSSSGVGTMDVGIRDRRVVGNNSPICGLCYRRECYMNRYFVDNQEFWTPSCHWTG